MSKFDYHISAIYPDGNTPMDSSRALVAENDAIKSVGGRPLFRYADSVNDRTLLVWYKPGDVPELKNERARKVERNGSVKGYSLEVFDDSNDVVKFKQRLIEEADKAQLKGLEPEMLEIQEYMHRFGDEEDVLPRWVLLMKTSSSSLQAI